jgi:hypothetical protein
MSRPDEGLIHTWLDGELDAVEAARVEALVKSDPAWAAAAAEARGFVAATARIVSALDDVPANVVPKAKPAAPLVLEKPRRFNRTALVGLAMAASLLLVVQLVPEDRTVETKATGDASASAAAPAVIASAPSVQTPRGGEQPTQVAANEQERARRDQQVAPPADGFARQRLPQDQLGVQSPLQSQTQGPARQQQLGSAGQGGAGGASQALASADAPPPQVQGKDESIKQKELDSLSKKVAEAPAAKASLSDIVVTGAGTADARRLPAALAARSATGEVQLSPIVIECYREPTTQAVLRVARTNDSSAAFVGRTEAQLGQAGARAEVRSNRLAAAPAPSTQTITYRVKADTLFVNDAREPIRAIKIVCPQS